MSTVHEIEAAVEALPKSEQEKLLDHLTERLGSPLRRERLLPLVPATGHVITQAQIDDALDPD